MKKTIIQFAIMLLAAVIANAQAPQQFNYQGVARSTSGAPLASTAIGLRLTIHDGSSSGTTVYQETQTPTTNAFGLYNVAIGGGTVVSGTFASINWAAGSKYLEVEIDPAGGTSYTSVGANQLLSVPYAMYAAAAGGGSTGTVTSVTAGAGLSGGTITTSGTISMPNVGTAGTYGSGTQVPVFTTDAQGRVTGVTNTTITAGGTGTVTTVNTTAGQLTGGPITTTGTLGLATAGTAGTYGSATQVPVLTTDAYGRVTAVTNTTITVPTVSGTTNYVSKFTSATAVGNSQIFDNGTSVGLGTITPTATNKLQVVNASSSTNQHAVHGISGAAASGSITINSGLYGESSTGIGISGVGQANDGVFGYSLSGTAAGVEGYNSAVGGSGILGEGDPAGSYGGFFDGGSAGYGLAVAAGLSGFGVVTPAAMVHVSGSKDVTVTLGGVNFNHQAIIGQTGSTATSNVSTGVVGYSANSTYENHGLHAFARGPGGAAYNVGVFSSGTSAVTTTGNDYGYYGTASSGASNYGIYATASGSGTNYAGYFAGTTYATTVSGGTKPFKIDDPRDPANKYLYHSAIESNDMMNIYNGNVVTDASGDAVITLPSYFSILNKEYKYQLTCIGQFAQAIVSEEISGNQFKIKTDKPNVKVSWQVSGVRQDPVANMYRIVNEVEKPESEKGKYLQPEVYGMGPEKGVGYLPSSAQHNRATTANEIPTTNGVNAPVARPLSGKGKAMVK